MKLTPDLETVVSLGNKREFPEVEPGSMKGGSFPCRVKREVGVQCEQFHYEVRHEVGVKCEQFSTLALACSSVWKQSHPFSALRTSTPLPFTTASSTTTSSTTASSSTASSTIASSTTAFSTTASSHLPPTSARTTVSFGMHYVVGFRFTDSPKIVG